MTHRRTLAAAAPALAACPGPAGADPRARAVAVRDRPAGSPAANRSGIAAPTPILGPLSIALSGRHGA